MSVISCINERRSIRSYKDEPIDEKTIDDYNSLDNVLN